MHSTKPISDRNDHADASAPNAPNLPDGPDAGRRSFFWQAGAALSGALAYTGLSVADAAERRPGLAARGTDASKPGFGGVSGRLSAFEDRDAIRGLHHAFGHALGERRYEDVIGLFADDAQVHFNGGVFAGREHGIRRLYALHFGGSAAAGRAGPVQRLLLQPALPRDLIEVDAERRCARARFHCLVLAEAAMDPSLPLVDMARQQGQGVTQWWERGIFDNQYGKVGDAWRIRRLVYHAQPLAQPVPGLTGSHTRPAYVLPFALTYPRNPAGPDRLDPAGGACARAHSDSGAVHPA